MWAMMPMFRVRLSGVSLGIVYAASSFPLLAPALSAAALSGSPELSAERWGYQR